MEKKNKKKLTIVLSIILVLVVASIVSVIFIVKGKTNNKNSNSPASNVNMTTEEFRRSEAEKAIIRKEVSENYNGSYTFSHVGTIFYNEKLSADQIKSMLESKGARNGDENSFKDLLNRKKNSEVLKNGEIIVLSHGRYTCSYSKTQKILESGVYYGNDDLSDILIRDTSTNTHKQKYKMSLNYQSETLGASTGASSQETEHQVVIFKNIVSESDPDLVLITISYVYNRIKDTTNLIPDTDLGFNI